MGKKIEINLKQGFRITSIASNNHLIAIGTLNHTITLLEIKTLSIKATISTWSRADHIEPVFALGKSWLAFQSAALKNDVESSFNKMATKQKKRKSEENKTKNNFAHSWGKQEMMSLGYHSVKSVVYKSSKMFKSVMQSYNGESYVQEIDPNAPPGTIEIWDVQQAEVIKPIAIFEADSKRIEKIAFDPSGLLLATAPDGGQTVKIWNIFLASLHRPCLPLYILERGATLGCISEIKFTHDSSLVTFISKPKGTIHAFPISLSGTEIKLDSKLKSFSICNFESKAIRPPKLFTLHSHTENNSIFSVVSNTFSYPLLFEDSDEKKTKHLSDHSIYSFYSDGSLIRQDIKFNTKNLIPNNLISLIRPRFKWDLGRFSKDWAEVPTFKLQINQNQKSNSQELLANVELYSFSQISKLAEAEYAGISDIDIYVYNELPVYHNVSIKWRDEKTLEKIPIIKLPMKIKNDKK